jgi:hypothetical protein
MNSPAFVPLRSLKTGDRFLCGGKIYRIESKSRNEILAVHEDAGNEEKFIHLDRSVEFLK